MHAIFACAVLSLKKWKNAVLSDKTAFFLFFFQKKNFGRAGVNVAAMLRNENKNAFLSLKKWKNAFLSLKTAFFLFFFQKKIFGRADVNVAAMRSRCEAAAKPLRKQRVSLGLKNWP